MKRYYKPIIPVARLVRTSPPIAGTVHSVAMPMPLLRTTGGLSFNPQRSTMEDTTSSESGEANTSLTINAEIYENVGTSPMQQIAGSEIACSSRIDVAPNFDVASTSAVSKLEQSVENVHTSPDDDFISKSAILSSTPQGPQELIQVASEQPPEMVDLSAIESCTESRRDSVRAKCQICKRATKGTEGLMRTCKCSVDRLAHFSCLEKRLKNSNIQNIHFCKICDCNLKIERQDKPYRQWYKSTKGLLGLSCIAICLIFWAMLPYFVVYSFLRYGKCQCQNIYEKAFWPATITLWIFGYFYTINLLMRCCSKYWNKWHRSNQDIKLTMYAVTESQT